MTEHKLLDAAADVLPVGLQPTPFGDVWQALQQVAAQVWNVDPSVYRAGIAWLWYALRNPAALDADGLRPLLVAALISEQAPLVKDTQTTAELAEYLRLWRGYTPTYPKLEALYRVFAADVEILLITAPGYAPPANTRLAFFVVIRGIDFDRPLTADEAALIAVRATPMGSHPVVVTELSEGFSLPVYPLRAGVPGISVENDAICEPVTPPTPAYTEITLYMASGRKDAQSDISSGFSGNVDPTYVYPLYYDSGLTDPFAYDYSKDYEVGYYSSSTGEWVKYAVQSVSDMPSSGSAVGRILLDTGDLWLITNAASATMTSTSITVRIYPKGQQYYAAYAYGSSMYGNAYIGISNRKPCVNSPGSLQYIQTPHQFPHITLQKVLGAAGNEITATTFETGQGADGTRFYVYNSGTREAYIRTVIYTLEYPVIGYWLKSDGTNISTSSGVAYPLMNLGGEIIEIDDNFDYFPIALIQHNGNFATATERYLNNATMGAFDPEHPTWLCFKQVSGTLSLSYVQYYKKPKS